MYRNYKHIRISYVSNKNIISSIMRVLISAILSYYLVVVNFYPAFAEELEVDVCTTSASETVDEVPKNAIDMQESNSKDNEEKTEEVPKDVISISLPTITEGAESPLDFIIDPFHLLEYSFSEDENVNVEHGQSMYFCNDDGEYDYSHVSDPIVITNNNKSFTLISIKIKMSSIEGVEYVKKDNVEEKDTPAISLYALDNSDTIFDIDEEGYISIVKTLEDKYSFTLHATCNESKGWSDLKKAPKLLISWHIETQEIVENKDEEKEIPTQIVGENLTVETNQENKEAEECKEKTESDKSENEEDSNVSQVKKNEINEEKKENSEISDEEIINEDSSIKPGDTNKEDVIEENKSEEKSETESEVKENEEIEDSKTENIEKTESTDNQQNAENTAKIDV